MNYKNLFNKKFVLFVVVIEKVCLWKDLMLVNKVSML